MGTEDDADGRPECGPHGSIYSPGCPGRLALDRIGDRWTVLIVGVLEGGTHRFSELRDAVGGITPKVLTQALRSMEADGLVARAVYAEVPPPVEYSLTDLGRSLATPIEAVRTWAMANMEHFVAAKARRRRAEAP